MINKSITQKSLSIGKTLAVAGICLFWTVLLFQTSCIASKKTTLFYSGEGKYMIYVKPIKLQQGPPSEPKTQMVADFTHHVSTQPGLAPDPTVLNFSLIGTSAFRALKKISFGDAQNPDTVIHQTGQIKLLFIEPKGKNTLSRYSLNVHSSTFRKWMEQFPVMHIETASGQVLHFKMPATWQKNIAPRIKSSL
jgi:hypothetical protein